MKIARDPFVDILKGIGIISIVMGHTAGWIIPFFDVRSGAFVYTYHIMIFMFVGGYTFNKKNAIDPDGYIGKRIRSIFKLFFTYTTIFVLLHNFLYKLNLLESTTLYSKTDIMIKIVNGTILKYSEDLLGTFWFLPVYLLVTILFTYSMNLIYQLKDRRFVYLLAIVLFSVVGIAINVKGIKFPYHIQTVFLSVPIMFLGYFTKLYWENLKKYVNFFGGILAVLILLYVLSLNIGEIELAKNQIINPYLFYPVTVIGMYFCLALGKIINKTKINNGIAYIGKNSFHIMGLHFVSFKLIDLIVSKILNVTDVAKISKFPNAEFDIKIIYILGGILIPILIISLIRIIGKHILFFLRKKDLIL